MFRELEFEDSNIKDNFKKGIKTFFDESKTLMRE